MHIRVFSSFSELPQRYEALFEQAAARSVFYSREWLSTLAEVALGRDRVRLYGVEPADGGLPRALLAARIPDAGPLHGLTNSQSFLSSLVLSDEPGDLAAVYRSLASALRDESPRIPSAELELLRRSEAEVAELVAGLEAGGLTVIHELQDVNRYGAVSPKDARAFTKKSTRRREKKLRKAHEVTLEIVSRPDEVVGAIEAYEAIYDRTWKEPDAAAPFVREVMRRFAERGWLRIAVLTADGTPVAAEVFFVHGGVASSFKTAYDLAFKEHSVGSIVLQHMLQHVIEVDEVREIDFGPGDEPYKRQWLSETRPLWRIYTYDPRTPMGLARYASKIAKTRAVDAAKEVRDAMGPERFEQLRGLLRLK